MKKEKQAAPYRMQLSNERTRRGWSQQDVADRVGTTPVNVSRWERGVTAPNPYFRQQLTTLFGKNLEELGLHRQEPPTSNPSSQLQPPTTANNHNTVSPVAAQQDEPLVPAPAPTHTPPASRFSLWHSSRYPFAARLVTLISLVLLFVLIGLFWFNSTHAISTVGGGKSIAPSTSATDSSVPAEYNVKGQLLINDPLTNSPTQAGWHISNPKKKPLGCYFLNGTYHMRHNQTNYCLTDTFLSPPSFIYQITMAIVRGTQAGVLFRVDDQPQLFYEFLINTDGSYYLARSEPVGSNTPHTKLAGGPSSVIHTGLNAPNKLGIKVMGADISLYINSQFIVSVHDATYTSGRLGVMVIGNNGQDETEAVYSNAKVWTL